MDKKKPPLVARLKPVGAADEAVCKACPAHGCPTKLAIYHIERDCCNSWMCSIDGMGADCELHPLIHTSGSKGPSTKYGTCL